MDAASTVQTNMHALEANEYPGRGIVIGQTPDAGRLMQVYWIMGRSENSRNRVFLCEGDVVRTHPYDESKVDDPSLIIYNCVRICGTAHVVTNGDQTDTICDALEGDGTFESALCTRTFEPDAPNFTPRISGVADLADDLHAYKLAILKAIENDGGHCTRQFFNYETPIPGVGHCVTTYAGNGSPLPAFVGEPYMVRILDDVQATADMYWEHLNEDNKISLLVKAIDSASGETEAVVINKHTA